MATQQKQKVFVYDRKEVVVLAMISVVVAAFAFTLGVHLGKRVAPTPPPGHASDAESVATVGDSVPNRAEIQEQAKGLLENADEAVEQDLREAVQKEGLKLEQKRQVELPKSTLSHNAGATTPRHAATSGSFLIQIGSFPDLAEAESAMKAIEAHGLKPFVKKVDRGTQGNWFRVFLGPFEETRAAETAGKTYQSKKWIQSFIVTRSHD